MARDVAAGYPVGFVNRLGGAVGIVPVAGHDAVTAGQQFARHTARHDPPLLVDDLDLDMRQDAADRRHPPLERIVDRGLEAHRAGLGHAVGDGDLVEMHLVLDPFHQLDGTWSSGHDAGPQRGQIEFRELRAVQLGDEHGRHAVQDGAAFGLDRAQDLERIVTGGGKHHGRAMGDAAQGAQNHPKQ